MMRSSSPPLSKEQYEQYDDIHTPTQFKNSPQDYDQQSQQYFIPSHSAGALSKIKQKHNFVYHHEPSQSQSSTKKQMQDIVKNLFSRCDSRTSTNKPKSLLDKYIRSPTKLQQQSHKNRQEIKDEKIKKPKRDVFSRFQQDLKMRRLRESFYQNLKQHVSKYDNQNNVVVNTDPRTGPQVLSPQDEQNLLKRSHKRRKFVNLKDQCAIVSSPDRSALLNKVAKSQDNFCKWRAMSTQFFNAFDQFEFQSQEGGGVIDLKQKYQQYKDNVRDLQLSSAEQARYGFSKQKGNHHLIPYDGCWRTVEQLQEFGDTEYQQNPELVRKLGTYQVPSCIRKISS